MRKPRKWLRLFAVFAAVALIAGACGDDDDEEAGGDGDAAEEADDFDGTSIGMSEYEFDVPEEIHASTVNFQLVNNGNVAHEAALVKLGEGETPEEFLEAFDEFVASDFAGPLPDTIFNGATILGDVQPDEDPLVSESTMTAGNWLLFCALTDADTETGDEGGGGGGGDDASGRAQDEEEEPLDQEPAGGEEEEPDLPPHYQLGMWTEITVTGDEEPEFPSADATIEIVDYGFNGTEDLEAGEQTLVAANAGPDQLHHIVGFDFGEGVDPAEAEEQFKALLASEGGGEEEGGGGGEEEPAGRTQEEEDGGGEGGPPGGEPEEAFFSGLVSPGYGQTFDANLQSGRTYLMACFISDREGGPPHAVAYDMFKAFTVS